MLFPRAVSKFYIGFVLQASTIELRVEFIKVDLEGDVMVPWGYKTNPITAMCNGRRD